MNFEISKELFFEVKEHKDFDFTYSYDTEKEEMEKGIELFYFICKEWAFYKGFEITSGRTKKDDYICFIQEHSLSKLYDFYDNENEIKATIKACQWILDNQNNQK